MSQLHDDAPTHSFEETRRIVEAALGQPLGTAFVSFERRALASGSIAQVGRAAASRATGPRQAGQGTCTAHCAQALLRG